VIVLKQETKATEDDIIRFATQHLASYKKPRKVVFVDEIPRTPSGKIQKYILRERYGSNGN
jgi:fatty-acyl-CoA synthase